MRLLFVVVALLAAFALLPLAGCSSCTAPVGAPGEGEGEGEGGEGEGEGEGGQAPLATEDAYEIEEDATLGVSAETGVLGNDSDADGDALTAVLVDGPANGALTLNDDGSFLYAPNAGYSGPDSFSYQASDGVLTSETVFVSIAVAPVPDEPLAADDSYALEEDQALSVAAPDGVLQNDIDEDGDILSAILVDAPVNGSIELAADGSFLYTPNAAFSGDDSFTYQASDGALSSALATVTLAVASVADAPLALPDAFALDEDQVLIVAAADGVLGNDSDGDLDALSAILVDAPAAGALDLAPDGSFVYTPPLDFFGTATFTYQASDGALFSETVTVELVVNPVNDAPLGVDDGFAVAFDTRLDVAAPGVLAGDVDVDGDPISAALVGGPANGTLTLNADGSFSYTANSGFSGTDSFTYVVSDGTLSSPPATVTLFVALPNQAPVANDDAFSTAEDVLLTVAAPGVLANDSDPEGDAMSAVLVSAPSGGALTLNADGSFSYTPPENFNGSVTFSYAASDGLLSSAPVTVVLTMTSVNDAPVALADTFATDQNVSLSVPAAGVLRTDSDVEGDPLSAVLVTGPANGTLALSGNGAFTYAPALDFVGTDSFAYRASDGVLTSSAATVTIAVGLPNRAPVAAADSFSTDEDTPLVVAAPGVMANDSDPDGDAIAASVVFAPNSGRLLLAADGSFTYTPNANFTGSDSFQYRVSDGALFSEPIVVTITVSSQNDAPLAATDAFSLDEDSVLSLAAPGVLVNDSDADGDALSAVLVSGPANGALAFNADGSFSYTPNANFNGSDAFVYRASDGLLQSADTTVTLTVTAVNDAPVIVSFTASPTAIGSPGTSTLTVVATDVDGDPLTFTYSQTDAAARRAGVTLTPAGATATVSAAASVPRGVLNFAVTVSDGSVTVGPSATAVTVNNHAPVANAGADRSLLPGETIVIAGSASDVDLASPDQPDTIASTVWTLLNPVAGVSLLNATTLSPTFAVDRAVYQGGPAARAFSLRLVVTDDQAVTGTDEVIVTVLDERGIYVDIDSTFSGTGPAGFCGHIRHPCNTLRDALINTTAAIAAGVALEPNLHVATRLNAATGLRKPYLHTAELLLNTAVGVRCGFDPTNLDASGDWLQSAERSPLRFTSANGVRIANDGTAARVLLQRCDVENINGAGGLDRIGVLVDGEDADLADNRIVGAGGGAQPGLAVGVSITTATRAAPTTLIGNTVRGAEGTAAVADTTVGVRLLTEAALTANAVLGGTAATAATGILADGAGGAFTFSGSDDLIDGATAADTLRGVHLRNGGSASLLRAAVRGRVPSPAVLPIDASGIEAETGAALTLTDGSVDAGSAEETAIAVRHGSAGRLRILQSGIGAGAVVIAGDGGTGGNGLAVGIAMTCPAPAAAAAPHQVIGATVSAGTADITGGLTVADCGNIELTRSSFVAGAAVDRSVGVESLSTRLVADDIVAAAGSGDSESLGLNVVDAQVQLQNVDAAAAPASGANGAVALSAGARVENLPTGAASSIVATIAGRGVFSGDDAGAAVNSDSAGLFIVGLAQGLALNGLTLQGAAAEDRSAGLVYGAAVNGGTVSDTTISGGTALLSFGVRVVGTADNLDMINNVITGGATSGATTASGSSGLRFEDVCRGCFILENDIVGGTAPGAAGFSVGMRTIGKGATDPVTYVVSNAIRAGAADRSTAVVAEGFTSNDPADDHSRIRYLHNVLDAGGRPGGTLGAAVHLRLQDVTPPAGANQPAAFAGNILVPGVSNARIGFIEECRAAGGTAAHSRAERAENTNFHDAIGATFSVLVREIEPGNVGTCGATNDETSILDVNTGAGGLAPYRQASAANTSHHRDAQFAADRVHLQPGAFLRDKGLATPGYWSDALLGAMPDYDGESRPLGAAHDIGADELQ